VRDTRSPGEDCGTRCQVLGVRTHERRSCVVLPRTTGEARGARCGFLLMEETPGEPASSL